MAAGWTQPPCRSSVMDIYLPPAASPLDAPGYAQQGLHQLAAASLRACPECWPRGRTRPHAAAVSTTVRGPRDRLVVFWHDRWVRQHDAFADQGSGRAGSRSRWPAQLSVAPRRGTQPPNMCPGNKLKSPNRHRQNLSMYERMAESRPLSWQLSGNVQFWEMYSLAQVLTPLSRKKWPVGPISRSRGVK